MVCFLWICQIFKIRHDDLIIYNSYAFCYPSGARGMWWLSHLLSITTGIYSEVGAGEREGKKSVQKREEKKRKKRRKRRAWKKKSANWRFFSHPQWKSGFRAQSHLAGGKTRCTLQCVKETEGKRHRRET